MKEDEVTYKTGEQYNIFYIDFKELATNYYLQRQFKGKEYHRVFRLKKEKGAIRMKRLMRDFLRCMDRDILYGATMDFDKFSIKMNKQRTNRKSPTIKDNHLYIPAMRMKKPFRRIWGLKLDIVPTLRYNMEIAKILNDTRIYENL